MRKVICMMKFKYAGLAEILHLNARKEGPDDDKELAVDVKLRVIASHTALEYFDDALSDLFYTSIGAIRNEMIGPVPMKHEMANYRLEALGCDPYFGVRLKKFTLEAMDGGRVQITLQASIRPTGNEVAQMAEHLQDMITIKLEPDVAELDFGGQAMEAA